MCIVKCPVTLSGQGPTRVDIPGAITQHTPTYVMTRSKHGKSVSCATKQPDKSILRVGSHI